jgi:protein SCO1/2
MEEQTPCLRPPNGPKSEYFPNAVVLTHENRKALFYDDLLRGKTVLVSFMSVNDPGVDRLMETLRLVQGHIGSRLGRDVFMYSITVDPENDTPEALERLAARHGARPGWQFLTGETAALQRIRDRFFAHGPVHDHDAGSVEDCSLAMIRYGNEAVGLWGTVPSGARPELIAQRLSWVESRSAPAGSFKRRGPRPGAPAHGD